MSNLAAYEAVPMATGTSEYTDFLDHLMNGEHEKALKLFDEMETEERKNALKHALKSLNEMEADKRKNVLELVPKLIDKMGTEQRKPALRVEAATEYHPAVLGRKVTRAKAAVAQAPISRFKIDTATPCHATPFLQNFKPGSLTFLVEGDMVVKLEGVCGGPTVKAQGFGTVEFEHFTVKKVYFAPGLGASVLSVPELGKELDYSVEFNQQGYKVREGSCAAADEDGSAAAAGKIVCQGTIGPDRYYTIDAKVDKI